MRRLARIVVLGFLIGLCPRVTHAALIDLAAVTGSSAFAGISLSTNGDVLANYLGALSSADPILSSTFTNDNDIGFLAFEVLAGGAFFSAETTSYGGVNGFDPVMALLNAATLSVVEYADPTDPTGVATLPALSENVSDTILDDRLSLTLTQGVYLLLVTQALNDFQGVLGEPGNLPVLTFTQDGDPLFTELYGSNCGGPFGDIGSCRTGNIAARVELTPLTPPPAPVPEPATLTLFGIGAAGAALRSIRRRRQTPSTH